MPRTHSEAILDVETEDGAPRIRRTHAQRRAEAERRMLDAAVRIVAERGLEYLTLVDCGEAAGYSRALAAHYFGSKEGLISAIATHIVASYSRRLKGNSGGRRGLDGFLYSIGFYIDGGRDRVLELRAFHAVLGSGLTHPTISQSIAQLNRQSVESLASGIRICMEQGVMRDDIDPNIQARLLLSELRGLMSQWLLDPDGIDLDKAKSALFENLRRTLAP